MKNKKILNSFKFAIQGFFTALKEERNLKIHIIIMFLVIIAGLLLNISQIEWIICIILFGIVISAELVNTSIETIVDMVSPQINPKAKIAKDISACSVLVLAIASAIIGIIIFLPKVINIFIK